MPTPCPPTLFDDTPPWHTETLAVCGGHRLHVTQHGQPKGRPVLLLHGGPGSGQSPLLRRAFDPSCWRLIGLDQRGAGASRPAGGLRCNTTADLLADLRRLRSHLGIERWLVVGGSWGATLAVAHAADQPEAVAGLLLRAAFLARPDDIDAFFRRDTAPDAAARTAWDALAARLPGADPGALLPALAERLGAGPPGTPSDEQRALAAAWWSWEQSLTGRITPGPVPSGAALDAQVQRYRVQAHYLRHGCWLRSPDLLARAAACPPVPTLLLHGSADRICPPAGASALHAQLPHSQLQWVPGAGHDPTHPAMAAALVGALGRFARHGRFASAPALPQPAGAASPCRCA